MSHDRAIYLEGIDPNTEAGKYYQANRETIGKVLYKALEEAMHDELKTLLQHRKTFFEEARAIHFNLLDIIGDKTLAATRILGWAEVYMKYCMARIKECNNLSSIPVASRPKMIALLTDIGDINDVYKTVDNLEKDWRKLKALYPNPINSISKSLDDVQERLLTVRKAIVAVTLSLPAKLQSNGFMYHSYQTLIALEKGLSEARRFEKEFTGKKDEEKLFEAHVEKGLELCKKGDEKLKLKIKSLSDDTQATNTTSTTARLTTVMPPQQTQAPQKPPVHVQATPKPTATSATPQKTSASPRLMPAPHQLPYQQPITTVTRDNRVSPPR